MDSANSRNIYIKRGKTMREMTKLTREEGMDKIIDVFRKLITEIPGGYN